MISRKFFTVCLLLAFSNVWSQNTTIKPSGTDVQYWEINGKKTLLLGGSNNDNLFQSPDFEEQLELLKATGGNYVRNTMSCRDSGDLKPFLFIEEKGKYDLNKYNPQYWDRLDRFLNSCDKKEIIVQIEVWATFDFYRDEWLQNPFNPKNNVNMGFDWGGGNWSKLDTVVNSHPIYTENDFFRSVPSQLALHAPLYFQQKFVDKLLEVSLRYNNVLYCMDNETSVNSDWPKFWVNYIKKTAKLNNKTVYCTEMWDPHELDHAFHLETFDNPEIFDFVDISQNNHQDEQAHWDNGLAQFDRLRKLGNLRPVNNVKIYGNDGGKHQTTYNAIESFVQNVLMGCASARFHRPTSGQGLNETAQKVIKTMREVEQKSSFYSLKPSIDILSERNSGEAYARYSDNGSAIVYFPKGGEISINDFAEGQYSVTWAQVHTNNWQKSKSIKSDNGLKLKSPEGMHWLAIVALE